MSSEPIAQTPAEIPGHEGAPTPWPADDIEGVHGWLAIGSGTEENPAPWGRIAASQPTVLLRAGWDVPQGTTLRGLLPEGPAPLVVGAVEQGRFGCDGGHEVPIVPLDGTSVPGLIWLVSPTFDAASLPLKTTDDPTGRTWLFGERSAGLRKVDTYRVQLWYGAPTRVVREIDVSKDLMEGATLEPADTTDAFLLPQVSAAWKVGDAVVVGMYWRSFEGIHFEALVVRGEAAELREIDYLYSCAF